MALSPRENLIATLKHETHDYVPNYLSAALMVGFGSAGPGPSFEKGPRGGGIDGFGVNWVTPASGGGAPIPEPGRFLIDSETIVDWKKIIKFPDVYNYDWEDEAKADLERDPKGQLMIDFGSGNGPFERLAALMGFEEALISMSEEPEAVRDLLEAICDFKIQVAECAKKYYHADSFTYYEDIATERSLFMSPDSYRKLIKPVHARLNAAVKDLGMMPIEHTCGKADMIAGDMVEAGAVAWTSVQPTNDINDILNRYGDQFCIMGGYDTNGIPGYESATPEIIKAEVERVYEAYGHQKSFIFFGFMMRNTMDPMVKRQATIPMIEAANACSMKTMAN